MNKLSFSEVWDNTVRESEPGSSGNCRLVYKLPDDSLIATPFAKIPKKLSRGHQEEWVKFVNNKYKQYQNRIAELEAEAAREGRVIQNTKPTEKPKDPAEKAEAATDQAPAPASPLEFAKQQYEQALVHAEIIQHQLEAAQADIGPARKNVDRWKKIIDQLTTEEKDDE